MKQMAYGKHFLISFLVVEVACLDVGILEIIFAPISNTMLSNTSNTSMFHLLWPRMTKVFPVYRMHT